MSKAKGGHLLMEGRRVGKRYRQQLAGISIHSAQLDESGPFCYPEDFQDAFKYMIASMINPRPIPIEAPYSVSFDLSAAIDRTVWIVHCKHGARLLGSECIQCSMEGGK